MKQIKITFSSDIEHVLDEDTTRRIITDLQAHLERRRRPHRQQAEQESEDA